MNIYENLRKVLVVTFVVSCLLFGASCASPTRASLYDGYNTKEMTNYEKKVEKMSQDAIKQEANELLVDMKANDKEIERLTKLQTVAQKERDEASEVNVIEKGAALVEVGSQLKNTVHRKRRMKQMSAIIKSGYGSTFDPK